MDSEIFKMLLAIGFVIAMLFFAWIVETIRLRRQILFLTRQQRLDRRRRRLWAWAVIAILLAIATWVLMISGARARDAGQWEAADPAIKEWYRTLMRPDGANLDD